MKIDKFNEDLQASSESVTRSASRKHSEVKSYTIQKTAAATRSDRASSESGEFPQKQKATTKAKPVSNNNNNDCAPFTPNWKHGSFSFLNLLDGGDNFYPHRTQSISHNRKSSLVSSSSTSHSNSVVVVSTRSKSSSLECLSRTKFLVRSNPIGLVEPSNKRDGYAVGRDGSFYRSTEHIFSEQQPASKSRSSPAPSSSSSFSGMGIRVGSGIIATGKPVSWTNAFMPFGFVSKAKSPRIADAAKVTDASSFIQQGIEEIESLTRAAHSTTLEETRTITLSRPKETAAKTEMSSSRTDENASCNVKAVEKKKSAITLSSPFAAVDVMLKSCLADEEPIQFTVRRGKKNNNNNNNIRSQSLSRTTMTLPEQDVTISLPGSRRTSRDPSVDRDCGGSSVSAVMPRKKSQQILQRKSSSIEVFNGTYDMKVPHPKSKRKISADVIEIETTFAAYSSEVAEEVEKMSKLAFLDDVDSSSLRYISAEKLGKESEIDSSFLEPSMTHSSAAAAAAAAPAVKDAPNDVADEVSPQKTLLRGSSVICQESVPEIDPSFNSRENLMMKEADDRKNNDADDSSNDNNKDDDVNRHGDALKGLTVALETLQQQQYDQKSKLLQQHFEPASSLSSSGETSSTFTATSGRSSPDNNNSSSSSGFRSRKSSLDVNKTSDSNCQNESTNLNVCGRCHSADHITNSCKTFDDLLCPRCLEWDHWEDACPRLTECCTECGNQGHSARVHETSQFAQRRAVVDYVGWQHFQNWFYENRFRSWWQLNGCVGVPLYKIYQRNTEWRMEIGPLDESYLNDAEQHGLLYRPELSPQRPLRRRTNYRLEKDDSIEELMKKINAPRKRVEEATSVEDDNSGRSTPEHLKGYGGAAEIKDEEDEENDNSVVAAAKSRVRTYSETLKMLDPDILAELKI